jgi:hypothetical protein
MKGSRPRFRSGIELDFEFGFEFNFDFGRTWGTSCSSGVFARFSDSFLIFDSTHTPENLGDWHPLRRKRSRRADLYLLKSTVKLIHDAKERTIPLKEVMKRHGLKYHN